MSMGYVSPFDQHSANCVKSQKKTRLVQEPKVRLDDQPAQVYLLLPLILIVQANHRIMNPLQPPH